MSDDTTNMSNYENAYVSKADQEKILLMGQFAEASYSTLPVDFGKWQKIPFDGDINGLNNPLSGFQASVWVNHDTQQIVMGIAGTNDLVDVLSWPTALLGTVTPHIEDTVAAGKRVNDLVAGDGPYAGYSVQVTGHSLGGEMAQIVADTFGWSGVSFDGPGAKRVVDGDEFRTVLAKQGIVPAGGAVDFIDLNIDGEGRYGGSSIGECGINIDGTRQFYTRSALTEALAAGQENASHGQDDVGDSLLKFGNSFFVHLPGIALHDVRVGNISDRPHGAQAQIVAGSEQGGTVNTVLADMVPVVQEINTFLKDLKRDSNTYTDGMVDKVEAELKKTFAPLQVMSGAVIGTAMAPLTDIVSAAVHEALGVTKGAPASAQPVAPVPAAAPRLNAWAVAGKTLDVYLSGQGDDCGNDSSFTVAGQDKYLLPALTGQRDMV